LKIYVLPISQEAQPQTQPFRYPSHNRDFGVEQDFLIWIQNNTKLLTNDPNDADWHYLPVFWTRWHLNHNYGKSEEGLHALDVLLKGVILNDKKTFTICQNDDGPIVDLGKTVIFLSSRKSNNGIDIPLLCDAHRIPFIHQAKKFIACFNGNFDTHPVRKEIREIYSQNPKFKIGNSEPQRWWNRMLKGPKFIENIKSSYLSLAPRGYGGGSFRFYESMQLGVVPCMVSDIDSRPFKKFIDWDKISYYASNVQELENIIDNLNTSEALEKGKKAQKFLKNELFYQKWCKYVIIELNTI
jgi:hypothetical protein